jgi:small subunit ribosomal protein S6
MPNYETVFIARQDLSDKQINDLTGKFSKIIADQGGRVHKSEYWGLRTLAYRINKNRKGHYVLIESDAPAAAIIELERNIRLDEDVLRSLTTRIEALSEGPSVMMDRSPRGDDAPERAERPDRTEREAA